ncbi:hypothetical protein LNI95_11475 [Tenacibaculum dicentrarchi]|uniref:hypothetical protein n=1 Tax=Tenacibaculum finnmarkense TaxID=2781243 RepID=UPI001E5A1E18|nr:hypothetical protein [Tenacibaculum finnmarkense]MCD8413741.1 hypothetical protein [Tenacibaculum finnmarkense genomovar ulcerans]MCD8438283.1 hypothetical protein [Tenacibaculum dicentrarchi]
MCKLEVSRLLKENKDLKDKLERLINSLDEQPLNQYPRDCHIFVIVYKDGNVRKEIFKPSYSPLPQSLSVEEYQKFHDLFVECETNDKIKNSFYFRGFEQSSVIRFKND